MQRHELEHVIGAAANVAGETKFVVIGSQAILGTYPDAPEPLLRSIEADRLGRTSRSRSRAVTPGHRPRAHGALSRDPRPRSRKVCSRPRARLGLRTGSPQRRSGCSRRAARSHRRHADSRTPADAYPQHAQGHRREHGRGLGPTDIVGCSRARLSISRAATASTTSSVSSKRPPAARPRPAPRRTRARRARRSGRARPA